MGIREDEHTSKLAKNISITYSWVLRILREFEDNSLVILKKSGRENVVTFTNKGKLIREQFNIINKFIGD